MPEGNLLSETARQNCLKKMQFDSQQMALSYNKKTNRNLRAYLCRICDCWHLTSDKGNKRRRRRKRTRKRGAAAAQRQRNLTDQNQRKNKCNSQR